MELADVVKDDVGGGWVREVLGSNVAAQAQFWAENLNGQVKR